MRRAAADLRRIVDGVEIRSRRSFSVAGEAVTFAEDEEAAERFVAALSELLYRRMYCRPGPPADRPWPDPRAVRIFVEALSASNCGKGGWDNGWRVVGTETDGALQLSKPGQDLRFWASREQFQSDDGDARVGAAGRVKAGKELREMLPGFYMALGDVAESAALARRAVRFYWHLTAAAAPLWIAELTRRFNAATVPFRAKVLSDPLAYRRADAGVLYVQDAARREALALLPGLHSAVSSRLRAATPMFTLPLGRGLSMAVDPGDGQSFGQHRCRLIAEALEEAHAAGRISTRERLATIAVHFARHGLSTARPWLNSGSADEVSWPVSGRAVA